VNAFVEVWSDFSSFKAFNKVDPPKPISPSGTISALNPKFTWVKIFGATKYTIELRLGTGELVSLMEVKAPICGVATCSYKPDSLNLLAHDTYKWKVKAFNGYYGPYSSYLFFQR
jgi:hypothetical protein